MDSKTACGDLSNQIEFEKMVSEGKTYIVPSKKYCIEIAAKVPCSCLRELLDNAEKIQNWLKEEI